jgi:hypothetical protein
MIYNYARKLRATLMRQTIGDSEGAVMTGQHIWHIKVHRVGQAEPERADPQLDRRREPVLGEVIQVVVKRESVRAKVASFHKSVSGSTATYEIDAVEEHGGKPPGHREADKDEDDF